MATSKPAYRMSKISAATHVVPIGKVGHGKSTLVEKVTGITGISSSAAESFTRCSQAFPSECEQLVMIDTPGSNARKFRVESNIWIAHALNYAPVSLILIVVKADTRIDNTLEDVQAFTECFADLEDHVAVCVTHMDKVQWTREDFSPILLSDAGIDHVMYVDLETPSAEVRNSILELRREAVDLRIDAGNFLRFFRINDQSSKILRSVRDEVSVFRQKFSDFMNYYDLCSERECVDLVFEFQAYMTEEIPEAQKRVSEKHEFTYMEKSTMPNEAGHISCLTNQLLSVLVDVRKKALEYTSGHGVKVAKKCPHCGEVWMKMSGCDGLTTCGNVEEGPDVRNQNFLQLATFSFEWNGFTLLIEKTGERSVKNGRTTLIKKGAAPKGAGCGNDITWSAMAPVELPADLEESRKVSIEDVCLVPKQALPSWNDYFGEVSKFIFKIDLMPLGKGKGGKGSISDLVLDILGRKDFAP